MMKEFYIPSDGVRLHAKLDRPREGERCPLALVFHGFTGHMEERHIQAVCRAMNEIGFATLRVELYGHGQSDGTFEEHTLYKWVSNALDAVTYAKGLDFVTDLFLCGHSQGGLLTMLVAGMRPDDFRAVIPLAPAWMIPDGARQGFLLGKNFDPEHIPEVLEAWDGRRLSGNYVRVAQTIHVEDEIARYHGPVLIVQGDADEAVPLAYAQRAAELYDNCRLVVLPGDTHCYDHHLEEMLRAVQDFLGERKE